MSCVILGCLAAKQKTRTFCFSSNSWIEEFVELIRVERASILLLNIDPRLEGLRDRIRLYLNSTLD